MVLDLDQVSNCEEKHARIAFGWHKSCGAEGLRFRFSFGELGRAAHICRVTYR